MKTLKITLLLTVLGLFASCANTGLGKPSPFTSENAMKLKTGMSSKEIIKTFGAPDSIRSTTCGGDKPWACTIWTYGKFPYDKATFYFYGEAPDNLQLNNFDIKND